jgi:hypothetical protein
MERLLLRGKHEGLDAPSGDLGRVLQPGTDATEAEIPRNPCPPPGLLSAGPDGVRCLEDGA